MKRSIKIGKRTVPLWIIVTLLISIVTIGVLADYLWKTILISVEVKEPLEIVSYPTMLSLYPGETEEFSITIENHASVSYSVILDFSLDNTTYQDNYVTFSNGVYTVIPGQQNLTALVLVESYAPPVNASLTIDFRRETYPYNLVGYWKFDEGSGTIAHDSSGYDNDGMLIGGTSWVDGKYGKALSFDGIDDYVQIPDSQSLRVQSFTLEAWIYMTKRPCDHSARRHVTMVNKMHWFGGPAKGYKLDFEDPTSTNDDLVIAIGDGVAQRFPIRYNCINDLTLNQWHQIVGTFDGTTAKLYIDGELKSSSDPVSYTIVNDDAPLGIGQEVTGESARFNGLIDSVMVYNRALSAEEVEAHYARARAPLGSSTPSIRYR